MSLCMIPSYMIWDYVFSVFMHDTMLHEMGYMILDPCCSLVFPAALWCSLVSSLVLPAT